MKKLAITGFLAAGALAVALPLAAQQTAAPAPGAAAGAAAPAGAPGAPAAAPGGRGGGGAAAGGGGGRGGAAAPLSAAAMQGRTLFISTYGCAGCHAEDMRGGPNGNNLRRSVPMLTDTGDGKLAGNEIRTNAGHKQAFAALTDAEAAAILAFAKSLPSAGQGSVPVTTPAVFSVGDSTAGRTYFAAHCASCHAVTGTSNTPAINLAGIGAQVGAGQRFTDPKALQQGWLSPTPIVDAAHPAKTATAVVTLANGTKITGRPTAADEFLFTLTLDDGSTRTFAYSTGTPKIDVTYPLRAHVDLLKVMTDDDIHNVTAYLVTLK